MPVPNAASPESLAVQVHPSQIRPGSTSLSDEVERHYAILDRREEALEMLAGNPQLADLLVGAVTPLRDAFGDVALELEVLGHEEERLLGVAVRLSSPAIVPSLALRSFVQTWWLKHCHLAGGQLTFSYNFPHGV